MAIRNEHDLHKRRARRNTGVALALVAFALTIFAITLVKISNGDQMQAFDHTVRPSLAEPLE